MRIPGANVLKLASKVITFQVVQWQPFASRTQSYDGSWLNTFAEPVNIKGSWQPASTKEYKDFGLDLTLEYFKFLSVNLVTGVERYRTGDRIIVGNRVYVVEYLNNHWPTDGWLRAFAVYTDDLP